MNCPRCGQAFDTSFWSCHYCGFSADPEQVKELDRLSWLLDEIEGWGELSQESGTERIRTHYLKRKYELEASLGLHPPAFTPTEAQEAWPEYLRLKRLFREIKSWLAAGYLRTGILPDKFARFIELGFRLEGHRRRRYPKNDGERVEVIKYLLTAVEELKGRSDFTSIDAENRVLTSLQDEMSEVEARILKRLAPKIKPETESRLTAAETIPTPEPVPIAAPPAPRLPLRERLWRSILSERTLQALLFLGIFLLFTAAISFVIWGWKDFSALVRVAIPSSFTVLFFALGWFVRMKTPLSRSGIALSAIAALFIPIDSYTVYANYGSPPAGWSEFWLVTSLVCLVAYILAALSIQSVFFGYLTGVAAGSSLLAFLEVLQGSAGFSRDWYYAAPSVLAVVLLFLARYISQRPQRFRPGRWLIFAKPFRYLSLLIPAVLMPLTLGLRLITRDTYDSLHYALTVNWFLGGFIFGWGAIYHRSRSLGVLAAISLPVSVYLLQGSIFFHTGINPAWHAFGLSCLSPLYLFTGHRLSTFSDDPVLRTHGRTATRWGAALIAVAGLLSLTDLTSGAAAAASYAVLTGSTVLAAALWSRSRLLYLASFFAFTTSTFAMTELGLSLNQLGIGWASLSILHVLAALYLARRLASAEARDAFISPLVVSGYLIAGLALLPASFPYDGKSLAYALGNWLALSAWGAYLAYHDQPGFVVLQVSQDTKLRRLKQHFSTDALFHWFAALPLPFWIWITFTNRRPADFSLALILAVLAWGMVAFSHWSSVLRPGYRRPWRITGLLVSIAAPITAFVVVPQGYTVAVTLLAVGLLYFADALVSKESIELFPGGLVTGWGLMVSLERWSVNYDVATFILCLLVAVYMMAGLEAERKKAPLGNPNFLGPLYITVHILAFLALVRVYAHAFDDFIFGVLWTDEMQLWGAATQLLLGILYGLFAWGRFQERWGHLAAWLGAAGGGFIAIVYSRGHGSLAAKGALIAAVFVLAERGLLYLDGRKDFRHRLRAFARLSWRLYRRPLLVTGWIISVAIIFLSLIRNLILLGGGRIQQTWAAAGLLIITALYSLSARMFRKARFVWFAAVLIFVPWTILTNLGWFTSYKPVASDFAISWVVLCWIFFLASLLVEKYAPQAYVIPLKTVTHVLLPFAMLWAAGEAGASRYTVGLAIALYGAAAWMKHQQIRSKDEVVSAFTATKYFYPALSLVPIWCAYWLEFLRPAARHEHFGLLILTFGAIGLLAGKGLERVAPRRRLVGAYGLPAYLVAYLALFVGILLVMHIPGLLVIVLLYTALLLAFSAWLFENPLWIYPAAGLAALAYLIALGQAEILLERQGWWLNGLAAMYFIIAWLFRRTRLKYYGNGTLAVGFLLIALGLPFSSLNQVGALWGYGSAALLYALSAFWLRQPLLLTLACVLIVIPYANALQLSSLPTEYYGLALFPGALLALGLGWYLDKREGSWQGFPFARPAKWIRAILERILSWWALPLYGLGLGLVTAAPAFTGSRANLISLNFLLLAAFYAWAVYRFRARFWLLGATLALQFSVGYYIDTLGLWRYLGEAWLRFLPATILTVLLGLGVEKRLNEGSPMDAGKTYKGWSRPLYLVALADIVIAQVSSLEGTGAAALVTVGHALLIAVLASAWASSRITYVSTFLGFVALLEWRASGSPTAQSLPIHFAGLAMGYGVLGFGYNMFKRVTGQGSGGGVSGSAIGLGWLTVWERPLQRSGMLLSFLALILTPFMGFRLVSWSIRALFGLPFREIVEIETVWMVIGVLALVGLLYVAAAVVYRRLRLGYLAIGMLLSSWFLYTFYIKIWSNLREVQWYAMPAGLYLLGIGALEWARGNKSLARWLDYAAMLLMLGSLFWQTLTFGWWFALTLGAEGFAAFWLGSARRLRRFFYAGMTGVILATLGQLLNALQAVNQWITFGIIGLVLVAIAIIVERRLEAIKAWQQVLETWE